jgi:hypothetical protein
MTLWLKNVERGNVYPLFPGQAVVIGRGRHADIDLDNPFVSRQHCEIDWNGCRVWVSELVGGGLTAQARVDPQRRSRFGTKVVNSDGCWFEKVTPGTRMNEPRGLSPHRLAHPAESFPYRFVNCRSRTNRFIAACRYKRKELATKR